MLYRQPTQDDIINIVHRMYEKDDILKKEVIQIVNTFPNQAIESEWTCIRRIPRVQASCNPSTIALISARVIEQLPGLKRKPSQSPSIRANNTSSSGRFGRGAN
ncbi:hypothetical protein LINGRAHAP2_LOCUS3856 [Linum grandiflorum]